MGILDDFHYGREQQKEFLKKQKEKQSSKTSRGKKRKPNQILVGFGIAYEMLNVDKILASTKSFLSTLWKVVTPILLVIKDDLLKIPDKIRNRKTESSFRKWQIKEKFADIGKRLGK